MNYRSRVAQVAFVRVLALTVLVIFPVVLFANHQSSTPMPTPSAADGGDKPIDASAKKEKRGSLIIAPIPIVSPAFGTGMILGVGYIFKLNRSDKLSPASSVGLAGAFTNNGTHGGFLFGKLYFNENKYQTRFAVGKGKVNYDYFGIGRLPSSTPNDSVRIRQSGTIFFGEFMRNLGKEVFVGPRYQYRRIESANDRMVPPGGFIVPDLDLHATTAAMGFRVLRDTTFGSFYPTSGTTFSFTADFFAKTLGSNRTYQSYKSYFNGYRSLGAKQVLAYRVMGCSVSERAPFYDLCFFGANSDLRGYTAGEVQDRRMASTQVEYRRELKYRLGVVGFAGVGTVAPTWSRMRFDDLLPAAGVGLRFNLDKKNHINYRIDLGFGRNGHTLSMSVTEAF